MSYDPKSRKHSVRYRDGDTQELVLRHEAVQVGGGWLAAGGQQQPWAACRCCLGC